MNPIVFSSVSMRYLVLDIHNACKYNQHEYICALIHRFRDLIGDDKKLIYQILKNPCKKCFNALLVIVRLPFLGHFVTNFINGDFRHFGAHELHAFFTRFFQLISTQKDQHWKLPDFVSDLVLIGHSNLADNLFVEPIAAGYPAHIIKACRESAEAAKLGYIWKQRATWCEAKTVHCTYLLLSKEMSVETNQEVVESLQARCNGETVLHLLIRRNLVDMVRRFLQRFGTVLDFSIPDADGNLVLHLALWRGMPDDVLETLFKLFPTGIQTENVLTGWNCLHYAVEGRSPRVVDMLVDRVNIFSGEQHGLNPLFMLVGIVAGEETTQMNYSTDQVIRILAPRVLDDNTMQRFDFALLFRVTRVAARLTPKWPYLFEHCMRTIYGRKANEKWAVVEEMREKYRQPSATLIFLHNLVTAELLQGLPRKERAFLIHEYKAISEALKQVEVVPKELEEVKSMLVTVLGLNDLEDVDIEPEDYLESIIAYNI